jgi:hypothetical protein
MRSVSSLSSYFDSVCCALFAGALEKAINALSAKIYAAFGLTPGEGPKNKFSERLEACINQIVRLVPESALGICQVNVSGADDRAARPGNLQGSNIILQWILIISFYDSFL